MTTSDTQFVVVVGVDGSEDARTAAEWALREAAAHGGRLVVVHAWNLPALASASETLIAVPLQDLQQSAEELLEREVAHLRRFGSTPAIDTRLEYGSAVTALLAAAAEADMVVVGSRGAGRVVGLLLGSVSQAVVTRAECPVLVIPPSTGKQS